MRTVKAGTTDVSVVIRIVDSTDGTPETGVTAATGGLVLEYRRELAASVSLATIVDLAALTTAHTDKGIKHIGNGYYRLDLVDAACAAGVTGVLIHGVATGMVVVGEYIELVAYDPADAVRLGLTSLPNAAADAAGGLPISDAGGLDLDAKLANTNEVTAARMGALTDWINGGRLDLILDDVLLDTAEIGTAGAGLTNINLPNQTMDIVGNITGNLSGSVGSVTAGVTLAASAVQAIWDALTSALSAVGSIGKLIIDNLNATVSSRATPAQVATELATYDGPTNAEMEARTLVAAGYATPTNITAASGVVLSNAGIDALFTRQLTESYAADGAAPTVAQALMLIMQAMTEGSITSTTWTIKKLDGSTTAATITLDSAATPTSKTRAT